MGLWNKSNVAEQNIRTLVLDRMVTQGVRSEAGNEWHERFWTTVATCRRLQFLLDDFIYRQRLDNKLRNRDRNEKLSHFLFQAGVLNVGVLTGKYTCNVEAILPPIRRTLFEAFSGSGANFGAYVPVQCLYECGSACVLSSRCQLLRCFAT